MEQSTLESDLENLAITNQNGSIDIDASTNSDTTGTVASTATTTTATTDHSIVYSKNELDAIRAVRALLKKQGIDPNRIGAKTLALTTIVSKLRVDEAAEKYTKYLEAVATAGVPGLADDTALAFWGEQGLSRWLSESYAACGRDKQGRSVMWIRGKTAATEEDEVDVVRAGILYHTAIHADAISLREGITFVVDTSQKPARKAKNDAKLQKIWQAMPMRPQALLIAGASLPLRLIINALIRVASLFTKQKILDRIQFVNIEKALESIPDQSAQPAYLGGKGGGILDIAAWTRDRIDKFPAPEF